MRFTHGQGLRMPPQYTNALALVANVQERQALPAGYQYVVINSTANVYCRLGAADVTHTHVVADVTDLIAFTSLVVSGQDNLVASAPINFDKYITII